jgi:hypothetical protein
MRKIFQFLAVILFAFGGAASYAQVPVAAHKQVSEDIPPILFNGLKAYKDRGADDAIQTWIKGGPLDGSDEALAQADGLRATQNLYGAYQWFEVSSTHSVSPKTEIIYLVLDFDKGPLFGKFVLYQSSNGWIITSFNLNTKDELVFVPGCS